ncbi:hypothetical protein NPIL_97761, partial [Nephila pilipes]
IGCNGPCFELCFPISIQSFVNEIQVVEMDWKEFRLLLILNSAKSDAFRVCYPKQKMKYIENKIGNSSSTKPVIGSLALIVIRFYLCKEADVICVLFWVWMSYFLVRSCKVRYRDVVIDTQPMGDLVW